MHPDLETIRQDFIESMSHISHFWGFPKALGAIYGALYLSPTPLSLDELVQQVGVTKGAVSTNVRYLERLGMVHKHLRLGDRRNFYSAESDFWKIIKGLLKEREKSEFDRAIRSVDTCLKEVSAVDLEGEDARLASYYQSRMQQMQYFFRTLDNLAAMVVKMDELRLTAVQNLFGKVPEE